MNRGFGYLLLLFSFLLAAAASPDEGVRPPIQKNNLLKKSIAVISGTDADFNVVAARYITDALTEKKFISVVSQKKVSLILSNYPGTIRGPYTEEYAVGFQEEYDKTDMAKIRAIQQKLHVDYLYVIWMPESDHVSRGRVRDYFITQLFEAPKTADINHGVFTSEATGKTEWVFFRNCMTVLSLKFNEPTQEQELDEIKYHANIAADDIISTISGSN